VALPVHPRFSISSIAAIDPNRLQFQVAAIDPNRLLFCAWRLTPKAFASLPQGGSGEPPLPVAAGPTSCRQALLVIPAGAGLPLLPRSTANQRA
jgi:hypothetical protein